MSASRTPGSRWSALLFDLDGTLADTIGLILTCYRHTMRVHLGRELPDREWLDTLGMPLRDQLRRFARSDQEVQAMLATYSAYQRQIHDGMVAAYPGVREVLEQLASAGTPMGVVTSKRREMSERTLRCCGLAEFFAVLVSADDVASGKPDPEPVAFALRALGSLAAETVLFVGDSPFDVTAGRLAGVRTAAALWGAFPREVLEAAGPDYFVAGIAEVLSLGGADSRRAGG